MGERGHLSSGEILEQLVHANRVLVRAHQERERGATKSSDATARQITNVVFMGMGEPLNNFEAVKVAVLAMVNPRLFGLSASRVTVSTVGVIPRIYDMADTMPRVSLALSLHAPTQATRIEIVPAARAFSLTKLIAAVVHHISVCGRPVMFEYVLLSGVNDSDEDARLTGALLRRAQRAIEARTAAPAGAASSSKGAAQAASKRRGGRVRELVKLNVIPYNPTYGVGGALMFDAPSNDRVFAFARIVRVEFGIRCTARVEMGQDIDGACGQLAIAMTKPRTAEAARGVAARPPNVADVEDLYAKGGGAHSAARGSRSGSKRRASHAAAAAAATATASRTRAAIVLVALACLVLAAHFALGGGWRGEL